MPEPRLDQIIFCMQNSQAYPLDREDCEWLISEVERVTRERDAYRKAKQENDERFMLEAAAARDEVARLRDESIRHAECCVKAAEYDRLMNTDYISGWH